MNKRQLYLDGAWEFLSGVHYINPQVMKGDHWTKKAKLSGYIDMLEWYAAKFCNYHKDAALSNRKILLQYMNLDYRLDILNSFEFETFEKK